MALRLKEAIMHVANPEQADALVSLTTLGAMEYVRIISFDDVFTRIVRCER